MTYDARDHRVYGIKPGVALLREQLSPVVSLFYFAHELVHVAIGAVETDHLACGIEEGFADVLGFHLAAAELMPEWASEEVLLNLRFRTGRPQLSDVYREALVRVSALGARLGWQYLIDTVRVAHLEGRGIIRRLENPEVTCQLAREAGNQASYPGVLDRVLAKSMALTVSPAAFAVGSLAEPGERLNSLSRRLEIDVAVAQKALAEIGRKIYLTVLKDDTVSLNEAPAAAQSGQLRYDPRLFDDGAE